MGGQKIRDGAVMTRFGDRLRTVRKEKGLSQKELAVKAGLSTSQIARMETGKLNTTISTLVTVSNALNIELSGFFTGF
jgi:transcriptional regulator with XRE-family HTH domain